MLLSIYVIRFSSQNVFSFPFNFGICFPMFGLSNRMNEYSNFRFSRLFLDFVHELLKIFYGVNIVVGRLCLHGILWHHIYF